MNTDEGEPGEGAESKTKQEDGKDSRDGEGEAQPAKPAQASKVEEEPEKSSKTIIETLTTFKNAAIHNLQINATTAAGVRRRTVGKLDEHDIRRLLYNFVTPKTYEHALQALSADHVVVLAGRAGDGRHAAAVSLLQDLTDERLNMLTPIINLTDLADRDYEAGQGFIVVDRVVERETTETDFLWRTVRDRVRTCAAYLVITAASGSTSAIESVQHIQWERPELDQVLRAHLPGMDADGLADLTARIPEAWRMADVARLCERLNDGQSVDDALDAFGTAAMERVNEWFSEERTLREVLAVATLSFASGTNHRDFESHLTYLDEQYRQRSATRKDKPRKATEVRAKRKELLGDDSLMAEKRLQSGLKTRTVLAFRSPGYQRWVLERLWRDYDNTLWDSISAWIADSLMILDGYELAYGLALLAEIDFDEVHDTYLSPWSKGSRAWPGQVTATYVLWLMCSETADDAMSRLALKTATRWATEGTPAQRWTAAIAFSGELGRLYPADALKRLWHLIVQSRDSDPAARFALAGLFAYLVGTDSDASLILRMLSRHLPKYAKADLRLYDLTMESLLAVFSVWGNGEQQPSVFRLLRSQPERMELVMSLWANLLRNHRYRKDGIEALIAGVRSLEKISDDPSSEVREIGEALSDALTPQEQESLLRGIQALHNRTRDKASALEVLLRALANTLGKLTSKGIS